MEHNRLIAKAEIVFSMAVFGTISIFVRNIPLPSAELALCRAVIAAATLLVWQPIGIYGFFRGYSLEKE